MNVCFFLNTIETGCRVFGDDGLYLIFDTVLDDVAWGYSDVNCFGFTTRTMAGYYNLFGSSEEDAEEAGLTKETKQLFECQFQEALTLLPMTGRHLRRFKCPFFILSMM
jgi:hypothetical protein